MTNRKNQRGASAVEFALVLPLLFCVLMGIVEFGLLLYNKAVITNASREGARAGIVFSPRPSEAAIKQVVSTYADAHVVTFNASKPLPSTSLGAYGTCDAFGDELEVNVSYPYQFLVFSKVISMLGSGGSGTMPGAITLSARTVMRCE